MRWPRHVLRSPLTSADTNNHHQDVVSFADEKRSRHAGLTNDEGSRANSAPSSQFVNDDHDRGGGARASTSGNSGSHGRGGGNGSHDGIHDTDIRGPARRSASQ